MSTDDMGNLNPEENTPIKGRLSLFLGIEISDHASVSVMLKSMGQPEARPEFIDAVRVSLVMSPDIVKALTLVDPEGPDTEGVRLEAGPEARMEYNATFPALFTIHPHGLDIETAHATLTISCKELDKAMLSDPNMTAEQAVEIFRTVSEGWTLTVQDHVHGDGEATPQKPTRKPRSTNIQVSPVNINTTKAVQQTAASMLNMKVDGNAAYSKQDEYQSKLDADMVQAVFQQSLDEFSKRLDERHYTVFLVILDIVQQAKQEAGTTNNGVEIELMDVVRRAGLLPQKGASAEERRQAAGLVYDVMRLGTMLHVVGVQKKQYRYAGQTVNTILHSAIWHLKTNTPINPEPDQSAKIPIIATIKLEKEWEELLNSPALSQWVNIGNVLSNLSPGRTTGAWARVVLLRLARLWRCSTGHGIKADGYTRQTLLEDLMPAKGPKVSTALDMLKDPIHRRRVFKIWSDCLNMLVKNKAIQGKGEPIAARKAIKAELYGKWWETWLDEHVELHPGPVFDEVVKLTEANIKRKTAAIAKAARANKSG